MEKQQRLKLYKQMEMDHHPPSIPISTTSNKKSLT